MKATMVFGIMSFWILAQITPSVMAIIDIGNSKVVLTLNGEEQKESVAYDADQKQLNSQTFFECHFHTQQRQVVFRSFSIKMPVPLFEIILPPPEMTV